MEEENSNNDIVTENEDSNMKLHVAVVALSFIIIFALIFIINDDGKSLAGGKKQTAEVALINPFLNLEITARSAYVLDVNTGDVLYALNENIRVPLASVTKLMTALVASEQIPRSTVIKVEASDIAQEGDSGLYVGERWRLSDLLDFTLVTSSNDGASAVASVVGAFVTPEVASSEEVEIKLGDIEPKDRFIKEMNNTAKRLGLLDTLFLNESGLDVSDSISGSYGSARDTAQLLAYMIQKYPEVLEITTRDISEIISLDGILHVATNTNTTVQSLPSPIASKTGFTDLAGGNLAVAIDAGFMRPIVIVVLGSTQEDRFSDVAKLSTLAIKSLAYFDSLSDKTQ